MRKKSVVSSSFECNRCHKCFSKVDSLARHIKNCVKVVINKPASLKETEKIFGIDSERSLKIQQLVIEAIGTDEKK